MPAEARTAWSSSSRLPTRWKCTAGPVTAAAPRKPREGTKQEAVLTLLRRTEGATIAKIIEATGWQQHTVRGFLACLKRKNVTIEAIERYMDRRGKMLVFLDVIANEDYTKLKFKN